MRSLIGLLALVIPFAVTTAQQQSACRSADAESDQMLYKLKRLVLVPSGSVALDRYLAGIPVADTATIVLVTDKTVCTKAEKAYTQTLAGSTGTPSGKVYVVKIGNVYVVRDPGRRNGEWVPEVVVSSAFKAISKSMS